MESQDQQNLCNRVIFHLFENFEKEMSMDFFIHTLKSQQQPELKTGSISSCRSEI